MRRIYTCGGRARAASRSAGCLAAGAPVNDAADYARPFAAKPRSLTLEQAAWITPPAQATDTEGLIDVPRMRAWRHNRLREQIAAYGLDAVVLVEPLSIRYAVGVRNCTLFQMHIQAGYLFMPADGPVIYFDSQPGLPLRAGAAE